MIFLLDNDTESVDVPSIRRDKHRSGALFRAYPRPLPSPGLCPEPAWLPGLFYGSPSPCWRPSTCRCLLEAGVSPGPPVGRPQRSDRPSHLSAVHTALQTSNLNGFFKKGGDSGGQVSELLKQSKRPVFAASCRPVVDTAVPYEQTPERPAIVVEQPQGTPAPDRRRSSEPVEAAAGELLHMLHTAGGADHKTFPPPEMSPLSKAGIFSWDTIRPRLSSSEFLGEREGKACASSTLSASSGPS
ncbi:hypothetical protein G5714_016696 [Onychostoma macrolepis]|uniref:Uncharacterized protein n=1 Tax=Onychostoma macrolepis TaxID=369639 RepID=A0A7J6C3W3_9TELE|nr:hypothetical protein G5714_016696 [Onychostoma macrolepis]